MAINPRQRIFVREFLKDKNATRSYIAAGYGTKDAATAASRMSRNIEVKAAIEKGLAHLEAKLDISAEKNIRRIAELAYHTPGIKHTDALKACELIGRHFGQWRDKVEHSGPDGGPQVVLTMPADGSEAES